MSLKQVLSMAVFAVAATVLFQSRAVMAEDAPGKEKDDATIIKEQGPSYPLKTCVVMTNKTLEEGKYQEVVVKGRLYRICCKGCAKKIASDPDKYAKVLDDAAAKAKEAAK